ncbi:hypothetical protein DFJ74DRAFT_652631 [Hyaloraphidium curvatum]|nr:hypothetical protein DFJ74DRAFT_652631 [Hyaloraphidium curvatum]
MVRFLLERKGDMKIERSNKLDEGTWEGLNGLRRALILVCHPHYGVPGPDQTACFHLLRDHFAALVDAQQYPRLCDQILWEADTGFSHSHSLCCGTALISCPDISESAYLALRDLFRHSPARPTKKEQEVYLKPLFRHESRYSAPRAPARFLRLLRAFFDPSHQKRLARTYLSQILGQWREPTIYRFLLDQGILTADANLVAKLLQVNRNASSRDRFLPDGCGAELCIGLFRTLELLLRRIAASGNGAGAGSLDLALTVEKVKVPRYRTSERKPLAGARGLILLLLFFGADPNHSVVKRSCLFGVTGTYDGLLEDVVEVARWRKWVRVSNIGGLPPEIKERIMLYAWEIELHPDLREEFERDRYWRELKEAGISRENPLASDD